MQQYHMLLVTIVWSHTRWKCWTVL